MSTNIIITLGGLLGSDSGLLGVDAAIRNAAREALSTRLRESKIEKRVAPKFGVSTTKQIATRSGLQDPPTSRKKKPLPFAVGDDDEDEDEDEGDGNPAFGSPFIMVSNTNAARDDNFDIYLNGNRLNGTCNFSFDGEVTTYLFLWDTQLQSNIIELLQSGAENFFFRESFPQTTQRPVFGSATSLTMQNVGQNDNGNFGVLYAGSYNPAINTENSYRNSWGPPDGENESFSFTWPFPPTSAD